jgi:uncharacterized membrane protein
LQGRFGFAPSAQDRDDADRRVHKIAITPKGPKAVRKAFPMARFGSRVRAAALLWNTIGIADLIAAIALSALSAPGPLQMFAGPPTSAIMTTLPWLIIPGFIVPSLIFIHVVIFYQLAKTEASAARHAWLAAGEAKPT